MKKLMIFPITVLFLMILAINVSAVPTFIAPTASGSVSGSYVFEVATTGTGSTNMTFAIVCTNYNTTAITIGTNTTGSNLSAGGEFSYVFDTTTLKDDTPCTVTATGNTTQASSTVSVTVDNDVPTAATGLETGTQDEESWALSVVVNPDNTHSCTIEFENNGWVSSGSALTYSNTAGTCTATYTLAPGGDYRYRVVTSDGTNETKTSYTSLQIDNPSKGHTAATLYARQKVKDSQKGTANGLLILLGLGGAFLLYNKK